jgi:hypothetical protein
MKTCNFLFVMAMLCGACVSAGRMPLQGAPREEIPMESSAVQAVNLSLLCQVKGARIACLRSLHHDDDALLTSVPLIPQSWHATAPPHAGSTVMPSSYMTRSAMRSWGSRNSVRSKR